MLAWRREFDAKPVLFATSDWFALALTKHRRELADHYSFHRLGAENSLRRRRESGESWMRSFLWVLTRASRVRSFSWWNWRDPLPWLGNSWQLFVRLGRKLLKGARVGGVTP